MSVLVDKKVAGAGFSNEVQLVRVNYDFAVDGGAIADYDVLVADSACVVELSHVVGLAAVTSGGAVTVSLGKGAAGVEFLNAVLKATLGLNSLSFPATKAVVLAAGEKISLGVAVAAITAGKLEMVFRVYKK